MNSIGNNIILGILTTLPIFLLMGFIYYKDKIEKEPLYLLFILFLGGIVSSIVSYFITTFINANVYFLSNNYQNLNIWELMFKSFISIALIEETSKWAVNFSITWKNKNFDYMYDQIVYSSFVALGFAFFENIVYCFYFSKYGYMPIIMRGFVSVPCHAVFGTIMGYYISMAKKQKTKNKKYKKYLCYSLFIPILLHAFFNLILFKLNPIFSVILIAFLIIIYLYGLEKIKILSEIKTKLK